MPKKQPELIDAIAKMKFRRLPPQAVEEPQWLDEPTGEGWYWIEGEQAPKYILHKCGAWVSFWSGRDRLLNSLRVAPCTGRPE